MMVPKLGGADPAAVHALVQGDKTYRTEEGDKNPAALTSVSLRQVDAAVAAAYGEPRTQVRGSFRQSDFKNSALRPDLVGGGGSPPVT